MRVGLLLQTLVVVFSAVQGHAQQVPEIPPKDWSIRVRFYGTTDSPGHDDLQISIQTNGAGAATILAVRPIYDRQGRRSIDSPVHRAELDHKDRDAIYSAARSVVQNHRIGEEPRVATKDGESVEISIGSNARKIIAVFDHSTAEKSKECQALLKLINSHLSKEFQHPVADTESR